MNGGLKTVDESLSTWRFEKERRRELDAAVDYAPSRRLAQHRISDTSARTATAPRFQVQPVSRRALHFCGSAPSHASAQTSARRAARRVSPGAWLVEFVREVEESMRWEESRCRRESAAGGCYGKRRSRWS